MSINFEDTSLGLKNIMDDLDKNKEYEFHLTASGTDVTSRFGDLENIQYHNDESLTVTCIDGKKGNCKHKQSLRESINSTIKKSETIASFLEPDDYQGLPSENLINQLNIECDINFPKQFTTDELINMTVECEKSALDYDNKIKNSEGSEYAYSQLTI